LSKVKAPAFSLAEARANRFRCDWAAYRPPVPKMAGVRLFENWLAGDSEQATRSSLRRPAEPVIEKLGVVLASNDKGLIKMVEMAIESSYGLLQHSMSREDIERLKAAAYGEGTQEAVHGGSEVVLGGPSPSRRRPRRSA
ncbi:MAG: hypothetical protein M1541_07515, partial [Acidobacteria bacterium]|nr:hypothetical protein [Acidobacteriota bacterium]